MNSDNIDAVNSRLRQSSTFSCNHCNNPINSAAPLPKDQELSCTRCGKFYHKRCTDRKKTPGNWKKSPWYCQDCILCGVSAPPPYQPTITPEVPALSGPPDMYATQLTPSATNSPPAVVEESSHQISANDPRGQAALLMSSDSQGTAIPATATSSYQALTGLSTHSLLPHHPSTSSLQPYHPPGSSTTVSVTPPPAALLTNESTPAQNSASNIPTVQIPPTTTTVPRLPNSGSRQRTSNITVNNAELEFNKTALSACRSTISQQEMELRRLKENIEIRNKRINQLEAQVSHATDFIASRETSKDSDEDRLGAIADKVERLAESVGNLRVSNPAHSIVINSCSTNPNPVCHTCKKVNVSTQTYTPASDQDNSALPPHNVSPVQCEGDEPHQAHPSTSL